MRLLVCGPAHPFRGGIAQTTTELVRALVARGHETLFLTPVRQYPSWLFPGSNDRDPDACPRLEVAQPCLDPLNPLAWPQMRERARDYGADAWVIPYWTWAWTGCWRYLLHGGSRPPVAAVVHNPVDHDAGLLQRLAAWLVLGRCDGLMTHAEVLARALRERYPWLPIVSHPLPAAALELPERESARARFGLPRAHRVALFCGLIRPYKGLDLLIDAFAKLPASSGWSLLVAGEPWGELGPALRRQVERLGLNDRVRLELRWISEQELASCLAAADVLVLPYRSGSQSAVAPLALANGRPVVSTTVGGLPELIRHGENGLLVPPGSAEHLAEALAGLDHQLLPKLAAGARSSTAHLSWSGYAETLEHLLATGSS